jgi:hypothetical protein
MRRLFCTTLCLSGLILLGACTKAEEDSPFSQWSEQVSGTSESLHDVLWAGGQLVAVGRSGIILTSPDGVAWTVRNTAGYGRLMSVARGDSLYVAVGTEGEIATSPDAITWTKRVSGTSNDFHSVEWVGGNFVAQGLGYTRRTSSDGITWVSRGPDTTLPSFVSLASNGVLAIRVSLGVVERSADGITWTGVNLPSPALLREVTWNGSRFVAVGYDCSATSADGIVWQVHAQKDLRMTELAGTESAMAGVGGGGAIWVSVDAGKRFSQVRKARIPPNQPEDWEDLYSVAWTGTRFVAVGAHGHVFTSP